MKNLSIAFAIMACLAIPKLQAQEITMFQGFGGMKYYQDDSLISRDKVNALMLTDSEANQHWKKFKKHQLVGWIALVGEVGFLAWTFERVANDSDQTVAVSGVVATSLVSSGFLISANKARKNAILKYNDNVDVTTLSFGTTYNGVGFVLGF